MPALSQLAVSNLALAKLPAKEISSVDENSLEARECRRFYPQVVSDALEGPYDWSFADRRVVLAVVGNSRSAEWANAYALPADCASPIRVIPDLTTLGIMVPVPLGGSPYFEVWPSQLEHLSVTYEIENGVLYTNSDNAVLEYTVNDVTGSSVSQLFITALATDLAARICIPVKQDQAREQALIAQTEVAWQRAIADDRNRQPQEEPEYVPEGIAARHGFC